MKKDSIEKLSVSKPASFVSIPFSFAFAIIFWIEIWLVVILSVIGYMVTDEYFKKLDSSFKQRGKELTLSLNAAGQLAYRSKKFGMLTDTFYNLVNSNDKEVIQKSISEIFLLEKSGKILAHSDLSVLGKYSDKPLESLGLKYNNEFFHSGLLISKGQVYTQKYPTPTSNYRKKSSYFIQWLLPENLDYSLDFSTPVTYKGENVATIHVIMNRVFMYHFLDQILSKFILTMGIMLAIGILIGLLLVFAFILRAKHLQKVWQNLLRLKWENDMVQNELNNIGEKLDNIQQKTKPPREKELNVIQDAILIK